MCISIFSAAVYYYTVKSSLCSISRYFTNNKITLLYYRADPVGNGNGNAATAGSDDKQHESDCALRDVWREANHPLQQSSSEGDGGFERSSLFVQHSDAALLRFIEMGRELQAMLQQIERSLSSSNSTDASALNAHRLLLQVLSLVLLLNMDTQYYSEQRVETANLCASYRCLYIRVFAASVCAPRLSTTSSKSVGVSVYSRDTRETLGARERRYSRCVLVN